MKKKWIFIIVILVLILVVGYLYLFYYSKCGSEECFNSALESCSRKSFIKETEEGSWFYKIKGKNKEICKVNVELLQLKEGKIELEKLQGEEMICEVPLGWVGNPQENLGSCHGRLKEEMQEIIITNLHKYIVDNLGEIGKELDSVYGI